MQDFVIKLARNAIENYVKNKNMISIPEKYPEQLNQKRGVFVTIYKKVKDKKHLRGCIGIPYPDKPLIEGIIEASVSASTDPRFPPLSLEELTDITIEVSLLTKPDLIEVKNPKEYLEKIKIGKHGLIIKKGVKGGLFLPKVPVDQEWDVQTYLENLCLKAGLLPDSWLDSDVKIYKFQAEVLEEKL